MAKTREEYIAELAKLQADAEAQALEYNNAVQNGDTDAANNAAEAIDKAVSEYKATAKFLAYDHCAKSENPMIAAVTMLRFEVISKKDEKVDGIPVPVRTIVTKEVDIDLKDMHKSISGGIGANKNWSDLSEQINKCMCAKRAQDIGVTPERLKEIDDSFAMSKIAAEIKLGKTPCSNTQMLKTLQGVADAMLGEGYKVASHDVNRIWGLYSKKSKKALSEKGSNNRQFRTLLAEMCHHIVTGEPYDIEFKAKK